MRNLGIIGFGSMGEAIAAGVKKVQPELELGVVEPILSRAETAKVRYGARDFSADPGGLAAWADIVVVAVKPQDAAPALARLGDDDCGLVSVMAGKSIDFLSRESGCLRVARFMPNLAAGYAKALVGVAFGEPAPSVEIQSWTAFKTDALALAGALGLALEIPERLMPALTGLSGSGIAYVFAFVHAMALAGVKCGLAYPQALEAVLQVTDGALSVLRESGSHPAECMTRVASPAGTTIEGLQVLEETGFTAGLMRAVEAAWIRAQELED